MDYDFSTLNDKEFEELAKQLLNCEFKLGLRSFASGRDKGIDLRKSSTTNKNAIVVQVKHFVNSTVSSLKNKLIKEELPKVQKFKPDRYVVVTSLSLSHSQKDFLVEKMVPYILSTDDIFTREDLNDLLAKHRNVEKHFYKLWLSSVNILQEILNNAVESRTRYFLDRVSKRMKFYVATNKINKANEILKEEKILLITGEPGVGKTTLAEIILFNRSKWGYKLHIVEDLEEAEEVISNDNDEKQIFYFDDFLGSNYTEIINSSRTETRLTNFVERIYNTPNKYIVLTTRTIVLNFAFDKYEKINNSKLNVGKFELVVGDYSKFEKAQILYNHLYFNQISDKFFDVILKDKFYYGIINHDSYRPRIIEFITDYSKIKSFSPAQYRQFILNNLKNPEGIWSYSFHNQINYFERCLLLTLYTYEHTCEETKLSETFAARLEYEKTHNNQILENNQYLKSLKVLADGFITITSINYSSRVEKNVSFINPSLVDYLINYVNNSIQEKTAIFESIIYAKQLDRFNQQQQQTLLEGSLQKIIKRKIKLSEYLDLQVTSNEIIVKTIYILMNFCQDVDVDVLCHQKLSQLDFDKTWPYEVVTKTITFINQFSEVAHPKTIQFVKDNFFKFITKILNTLESDLYASDIVDSFHKYDYDYDVYKTSSEGLFNIQNFINSSIKTTEEENTEMLAEEVELMEEVREEFESLKARTSDLFDIFGVTDSPQIYKPKIDEDYWQEKIDFNEAKRMARNAEKESYEYEIDSKPNMQINENRLIDNLFQR